ncbi:wall-associated receptor kinase-like 14 [Lolium perenne]|uniref:wall-associated receptor kinase-like 14 n=1 Tax=Lolium perenne TaxID=4522 RepID=UPI003A9920D8
MRGTTVLPLAAMVVVLLHAASRAAGAGGGGDGSCERSCGSMKLPYPFGFSSGCTIRLGCDDDVAWLGDARELGLHVRNVTARGIILELIPDCSRAFNATVGALFSDNYAPSSGNTLVVSSCSPVAQGARIISDCSSNPPASNMSRSSSHCSANESIRCIVSLPPSDSSGRHFLRKHEVLSSECVGLVSSMSYQDEPTPGLLLGLLRLDWWVQGRCRCSPSANCTQFTAPTGQEVFRC